MSEPLVISGNDYYELSTAFTGGTGIDGPQPGTYFATGEWGNPPHEGAPEYQDMEITLPGVDGIGIKRMGFRGRPIYCRMAFIGDDKSGVEAQKEDFFVGVTALVSFDVQVPGGTSRPSCRIVHGTANQGQWTYFAGRFVLLVDVQFRQFRLT